MRPQSEMLFTTSVPFVKESLTSIAAAESIRPIAPSMEEIVVDHIAKCGQTGSTCDEAEDALPMSHQSCSARIRDAVKHQHIRDSGKTRPTRSGRQAVVWVAR